MLGARDGPRDASEFSADGSDGFGVWIGVDCASSLTSIEDDRFCFSLGGDWKEARLMAVMLLELD